MTAKEMARSTWEEGLSLMITVPVLLLPNSLALLTLLLGVELQGILTSKSPGGF